MNSYIPQIRTLLNSIALKSIILSLFSCVLLSGCSTNPATGQSQFAALMSPEQETKVGAQEHERIVAQFGLYKDEKLQAYVDQIGARISKDTERPDVTYKFFIIDSPIVNAFALPGGYVYVSRGLLALANSEAEMAGVLAHEVAHITARHSAERYSHNVISSLGATVLSIALKSNAASQALNLGSNLYLSSYSRGQESEADTLGIRYLSKAGYNELAMASFLKSLQHHSDLEDAVKGDKASTFSYFSTHPATQDRVQKTVKEAEAFDIAGDVNKQKYFNMIDGLVYGDSAAQGFVRDGVFYHPELGFKFKVLKDAEFINQPSQIVMRTKDKKQIVIFDMATTSAVHDEQTYLEHIWMKDQDIGKVDLVKVNGRNASYASFKGRINNMTADIHLLAIKWSDKKYVRFQVAVPRGADDVASAILDNSLYSFDALTAIEQKQLKPDHIQIITALPSDSVSTLARRQAFTDYQEPRFKVLNGLGEGEAIQSGEKYKLVVSP